MVYLKGLGSKPLVPMPNHKIGYKKVYMIAFSWSIEDLILWERPWEMTELVTRTIPESMAERWPHQTSLYGRILLTGQKGVENLKDSHARIDS